MSLNTYIINDEGLLVQVTEEKQLCSKKPFSWDTKSTKLLIDLYSNLKEEFRNPKKKKKQLWSNIKDDFLKYGYNTDEEALDRKWRNLKKTFTNVKDNIRSTGKGRIYWEHYDAFNNIYSDDKTVNLPRVFSSSASLPTNPTEFSVNVTTDNVNPAENILTPLTNATISSSNGNISSMSASTPRSLPKNILTRLTNNGSSTSSGNSSCSKPASTPRCKSGAYYLRKRLADIEERRVEEIKMLRLAIERGNKIQEERTAVLKEFLDKNNK